jgi:hypothetical protein
VNASNIISLVHLNLAIARALIAKRDSQKQVKSLGNHIVYYSSPSNSIAIAMDTFGIKNCQTGFFAIFVDLKDEEISEIKQKLSLCSVAEFQDLNKHLEWQNLDAILKIFD